MDEIELNPSENLEETPEGGEYEKPKLSPEQIEGIKRRQLSKLAKELGVEIPKVERKEVIENKKQEKNEFDNGDLAYLAAKGIADEDVDFLQQEFLDTGKPLRTLLGMKYVQEELKNRAEQRKTADATPTGTKRSGSSAKDSVEYWLAKGELPPFDQRELRYKVVNAKIERAKQSSRFTDHPFGPVVK